MKTPFTVCALVSSLFQVRKIDTSRVQQACESYLNSMTVTKEDASRVALKERKAGNAVTSENVRIDYSGAKNSVSAFIAWNDSISSLARKNEKAGIVGGVLSDVPASHADWLAKFATQPEPEKVPEATKAPAKKKAGKSEPAPVAA